MSQRVRDHAATAPHATAPRATTPHATTPHATGSQPDLVSDGVPELERRALRAAEQALARARRESRSQWIALSAPAVAGRDVLAVFDRADDPDRFYWECPAEGLAFVGLGSAAGFEAEGADRFARASAWVRSVFDRLTRTTEGDGPWAVGGFAFEDRPAPSETWQGFPAARWVLPERMLIVREGRATRLECARVDPGDDAACLARALVARLQARLAGSDGRPPGAAGPAPTEFRTAAEQSHEHYRARVLEALDRIAAGDLEKVVLARSVRIDHPQAPSPARLLDALRLAHPACVSFAVTRGDATFLGATPERLVGFDGVSGVVRTGAVAGSAPRGRSPEEDARLARALRESKKEQAEHAAVVRAVRDALRPRCGELAGPEAPRRLALEGIQHLETPLEGRVEPHDRHATGVIDLAGDLHPTPAVGGAPVEAARRFIRECEGLERGWYAAPLGFVDHRGGGELRVALRSGLLRGRSARLYAGAGIVAGSEPERELYETRLKLRALLAPLLEV
ncbi:MAG: isochorismate synthase [Myxococcota bacterium]